MSNLSPVPNFIRPDKPHACTYEAALAASKTIAASPHHHKTMTPRNTNDVCENILELVGNTPMVNLKNLAKDYNLKCNLYAKCEYMNSGGSVKDRIGVRMVEEAEREGYLQPGDYVIEPTSGNTGIGLALACAVKGYNCIIVMPEKMSKEKNDVLKALGATIVRTPTSAAFDAPDSHISEAQRIMQRINSENPGRKCAHILDQYTNPYNPIAHYDGTGAEIVAQLKGKVDLVVIAAGTGGTVCGTARRLKELVPGCIVVGVDPIGSILALPESMNDPNASGFYEVEGTGYDFLPTVLERTRIDSWFKSEDKPSFQMSRQLIKREGLLCGGSAGSAMYCTMQAIAKYNMGEGKNVVCLCPDSVRNYMTKYLSDEWMITRGLLDVTEKKQDPWWFHKQIGEIGTPTLTGNVICESTTCAQACAFMKKNAVDCLLIVKDGLVSKVVTRKNIMAKLTIGALEPQDLASKAALDRFNPLCTTSPMRQLQCSLDAEGFAVVLKSPCNFSLASIKCEDVFGVVSADALLEFIMSNKSNQMES